MRDFSYAPSSNVELLVFLLDGSGSMRLKTTDNGNSKCDHLDTLVKEVLERLNKTRKAPVFRVSLIRFGNTAKVETHEGMAYFTLGEALSMEIKSNRDFKEDEGTDLVAPLKEAAAIMRAFKADQGMPEKKSVTLFLFTDGKHNESLERDVAGRQVIAAMDELRSVDLKLSIATISFGVDADKELLLNLASPISTDQADQLENHGIIDMIIGNRLFTEGHVNNQVTSDRVEVIRNFVETLSKTTPVEA
jgi:hypothetical protein